MIEAKARFSGRRYFNCSVGIGWRAVCDRDDGHDGDAVGDLAGEDDRAGAIFQALFLTALMLVIP
jgi:hypothetical protein